MTTRLSRAADDAEEAVLCAILHENGAIDRLGSLTPEDFADDKRGEIFSAMRALRSDGRVIDPITLEAELAIRGTLEKVGGKASLGMLVDIIPLWASANVQDHAHIVEDHAQRRALNAQVADIHRGLEEGRSAVSAAAQARDLLDRFLAGAGRQSALPLAACGADVSDEDPVAWRVTDLFTAGDFGIIGGEDGSMKSTVALHIAGAMAGGYRAFGRFLTERGSTLFVSEEDSAAVLRNRLEAMCRGHGWRADEVLRGVHFLARAEVRITSPDWQAHLRREIVRTNARLVVFDPWVEVTTGKENDNDDGRAALQIVRGFAKPTGANVMIVHHFGKEPAQGKRRLRDRFRGATAVSSGSRCTYAVEHDNSAAELKVTCVKLSRGDKQPPFVVRYAIEAESSNRAVWRSARFDFVSAQVAVLDKAETFVLEALRECGRLNTSELKSAAKGSGVSAADISRTLKLLAMRRIIDFEEGERGAKRWGLTTLPSNSGNVGNLESDLAGQPATLPGNLPEAALTLPTPFRVGKQAADAPELGDLGNVGAPAPAGLAKEVA